MGSNPNLQQGQVPTPAQWNSYFSGKQDDLGYTPANIAGTTMTGELILAAASTLNASLNIPPGVAPTSPAAGDLWTTTGGVFARIGGLTMTFGGGSLISAISKSLSLAATGDTPLALVLPFTNYIIEAAWIVNTGTVGTLSIARVGLFTLAGGSGINLFNTGTGGNSLSAITTNAVNNIANSLLITVNNVWANLTTLYFRVITLQAGASIDLYFTIRPLPS